LDNVAIFHKSHPRQAEKSKEVPSLKNFIKSELKEEKRWEEARSPSIKVHGNVKKCIQCGKSLLSFCYHRMVKQ
jgi:hypothetical protein